MAELISMQLLDITQLLGGQLIGKDCICTGVSTDSRSLKYGDLFVALDGMKFNGHAFISKAREYGACAALVTDFVQDPLPQIKVSNTLLALGKLAAMWRNYFSGHLIALTGSNGKTTIKEMIASILRLLGPTLATEGNLNNAIGVPITLLRLNKTHKYAVIEMGANHPGEIAYLTNIVQPDIAMITNAGPCHLEGFGNIWGVAHSKGEIFQGLKPNGIAVINNDDAYARYWSSLNKKRRVVYFSLNRENSKLDLIGKIIDPTSNLIELSTRNGQKIILNLPLPGIHNLINALAAATVTMILGANLDIVSLGLQKLHFINGRMQFLKGIYNSTIINDTYNANPASLAAALNVVQIQANTNSWLVLGDMLELGINAGILHTQAGYDALKAGFKRLYGFGTYAANAVAAFGEQGQYFIKVDDLITTLIVDIDQCQATPPLVLVKGSRGMHMEKVIAALVHN